MLKINPVLVFVLMCTTVTIIAATLGDAGFRSLMPASASAGDVARYDLLAQQNMSDAAWWMVWVTGISSAIGTVGIFLVWRTLIETKRTADTADKSLRLSNRAYLLVSGVRIQFDRNYDALVTYTFTNSGNAPARNVSVTVKAYAAAARTAERKFVLKLAQSRSDVPHETERKGKFTIPRFPFAMEGALGEHIDPVALIVVFELQYGDMLSRHREYVETSTYGRILEIVPDFDQEPLSLYRDVDETVGWGD